MPKTLGRRSPCSIARSLALLGEKWMILIVREALLAGTTRFSEFRSSLGVAPDVLANRLAVLVEEGVMERRSYREEGARERYEYVLTDVGRQLNLVIAGLSAWGRENRPEAAGISPSYADAETGEPAELCFVTPSGRRVAAENLSVVQTPDIG